MSLWEARDLAEKDAFEAEVEPPWRRDVVGLPAVLARWQASSRVFRNVTLHEQLPGREAVSAPLPASLHEGVLRALQRRGVTSLYSHQQRAIEHALAGRDVVIATPTASGKSLCFHVPVLEALSRDPGARALYLFPTKALSRDQEAGVREMMSDACLSQGAITYDGDTPAMRGARRASTAA